MNDTTFTVYDDDTDEEIHLPTEWMICRPCRGNGTRVLHGIAITADEWADWDDDMRDDYMNGGYDTVCEDCGGSGKVRGVNERSLSAHHRELYRSTMREIAEDRQMQRMERLMGA